MYRRRLWYGCLVGLGLAVGGRAAEPCPPRPACPPIIVPYPVPAVPGMGQPGMGQPGMMPGAQQPGMQQPGMGQPGSPDAAQPGAQAPSTAATPQAADASNLAAASPAGGEGGGSYAPNMIGDQLSTVPGVAFGRPRNLNAGAGRGAGVVLPSIRGFKIAENESPRPQDRLFVNFNYFDNVNQAVNQRFATDLSSVRIYRETFGLEKTFLQGDASIGFRLPLNTLEASTTQFPDLAGTNTALGDLTVILKYAIYHNREAGDVVSGGLAVTLPTGPDSFGGTPLFTGFHNTVLQPYVGYIFNFDRLFIHGFSAIDVPTDSGDVTVLTNDFGVGYHLLGGPDRADRFLADLIPTFEVHVNNPLNHRGAFRANDPVGTQDVVALTTAATFVFRNRSSLAVGFVTPVTGPKPFDFEVNAQFNWRFGASGAGRASN